MTAQTDTRVLAILLAMVLLIVAVPTLDRLFDWIALQIVGVL